MRREKWGIGYDFSPMRHQARDGQSQIFGSYFLHVFSYLPLRTPRRPHPRPVY